MSEKINQKEEENRPIAFNKKPSIYRRYRSLLSRLNDDEKMELVKSIKSTITKLGGYKAAGTLYNSNNRPSVQRFRVNILRKFSEFDDSNKEYVLNLFDLNQIDLKPSTQHNILSWLERNGWLSSPATVTINLAIRRIR
jgi:hypothetical protein